MTEPQLVALLVGFVSGFLVHFSNMSSVNIVILTLGQAILALLACYIFLHEKLKFKNGSLFAELTMDYMVGYSMFIVWNAINYILIYVPIKHWPSYTGL